MTSGRCRPPGEFASIRAMADEPSPAPANPTPSLARCPWCSATLESAANPCPSCGAQPQGPEGQSIPGVTEIDPRAIQRRSLALETPSLGSLLMGGVDTERPTGADLPALALPDATVRREMLRLELDATRARLEAEADALAAEEALRRAEANVAERGRGALTGQRLAELSAPATTPLPGETTPLPGEPSPPGDR
jgi:hypothetical protein